MRLTSLLLALLAFAAVGCPPDHPRHVYYLEGSVSTYDVATDTWSICGSMPTPRSSLSCEQVGTGFDTSIYYANVEAFDTSSQTWTVKTDMPYGRVALATAMNIDQIYVVGGISNSNSLSVLRYDTSSDAWFIEANLPKPLQGHGAECIAGRIYVFGGGSPDAEGFNRCSRQVFEYDTSTMTFAPKADMPRAISAFASCVVGSRVFVFGGSDDDAQALSSTLVYETLTDVWSELGPMPDARFGLDCQAVGTDVFVFGGDSGSDFADDGLDTNEKYDSSAGSWTSVRPMPGIRCFFSSAVSAGRIYVFGGEYRLYR
jgi:N-acetylneuraminic acid mutarotase